MKQLFARLGEVIVREVEEPVLRRGEVLVETAYSAISSGTELGIIAKSRDPEHRSIEYPADPPKWPRIRGGPRLDHPMPHATERGYHALGYSLSGIVIDCDDSVTDLRPGDRVACSGSQCAHHAERVAVPRNLVAKVPDDVSLRDAAFVTLGGVATEALRQTACTFGETVVLYGIGLLGLIGGQIGRSAGFRVIGIDVDPVRVAQAADYGFAHAFDPRTVDPVAEVERLTDGFGADGIVLGIVSPDSEPLNQCFDMARQRARVVGLGVFGFEVDRQRFFSKQVTLHSARAYGPGRYDPVYEEGGVDYPIGWVRWTENRNQTYFLDLLQRGAVKVSDLAPKPDAFADAPQAYERLQAPGRPPTLLLDYGRDG